MTRTTTGIDAMRQVSVLTAGKFDRQFFYYSPDKGRRCEAEPNDIAWNVLNWVAHTGVDSLQVHRSADGSVYDIELWEDDSHDRIGEPQVIYVVVVDK